MSLPSQARESGGRGNWSRSSGRRRRRKGPSLVGPIILLLAAAGLVYVGMRVFGEDPGPAPDQGFQAGTGMSDPAGDDPAPVSSAPTRPLPSPRDPAPTTAELPTDTNPPPVEIRQGGSGLVSGAVDRERDENGAGGEDPDPAGASTTAVLGSLLDQADALLDRNDPVGARAILSGALLDPSTSSSDRAALRDRLRELNNTLVFGPRVLPGDDIAETYAVKSGDRLSTIVRDRELGVHWSLIQRVNGISRPEMIRIGQTLKLLRGPFHAVVDKSDYRVDIFHGPPEDRDRWIYITSRPVGLGEEGSTPIGVFVVRPGSKLINPAWVNPRDRRERYTRDDPANPIGEHWVGLDGLGDAAIHVGYGLHGTIVPESVGRQESMGCVRMLGDDIELVYGMLTEGVSLVEIVP